MPPPAAGLTGTGTSGGIFVLPLWFPMFRSGQLPRALLRALLRALRCHMILTTYMAVNTCHNK